MNKLSTFLPPTKQTKGHIIVIASLKLQQDIVFTEMSPLAYADLLFGPIQVTGSPAMHPEVLEMTYSQVCCSTTQSKIQIRLGYNTPLLGTGCDISQSRTTPVMTALQGRWAGYAINQRKNKSSVISTLNKEFNLYLPGTN